MRVITGSARGRRLVSPEGSDIRPTTDKVKEALFSIIQFDIPGASVLDLFGGSGQLGIEAASRGAQKVIITDNAKKSADLIKTNVSLCRLENTITVKQTDAFFFLENNRECFDIVFLDPPYNKGLCEKTLKLLSGYIADNGCVICETRPDEALPDSVSNLYKNREYKYSDIKLTFYIPNQGGDE